MLWAAGAQPPDLDLKIRRLLAREAARQQASLFSPRVSKGLSPLPPEAFFLFASYVYATVACRRRLQKAPRRIHERLPRTHSRPAQGLDKDPKLVWDMLEAGNAKARARASRNLDALKKKLNFIFREGRGRCLAAGGSAPTLDLKKTMTPAGARSRAPTGVIVSKGFPKGLSPLPPEAFFLFAS